MRALLYQFYPCKWAAGNTGLRSGQALAVSLQCSRSKSTASNISLKMKIEIHRGFCPYRIDCPPCCFCLLLFSPGVNALFRIKLALISAQFWLSSPFLLPDFWTYSTIADVEVEKEPSSTFRRWQFPTFSSMDLCIYPIKDCSLWLLLLYVVETFL